MANVLFISDLHFGHKNILNFAGEYREGTTLEEHDEILVQKINSRVGKNDKLFILGDVVWRKTDLSIVGRLNGSKELIMGNHDEFSIPEYMQYFDDIHGFRKYKEFFLSHCPIHPEELRGCKNIHGHVHHNYIKDDRYICVCVEKVNGYPISLDEIRKQIIITEEQKNGSEENNK